jgi:glycosyltransferase involved in cell wall biosynthesis
VILLVARRASHFVELDAELLSRRWHVEQWIEAPALRRLPALLRAVRRSQIVVGWFAGWHSLAPVALARLLRRPVVLISGGFDVAAMPEIGYGAQSGGARRWAARWIMRRAQALVVNSHFSRGEVVRNAGIAEQRVTVIHHGLPDPFGELPAAPRERRVLTVGVVDARNVQRKGLGVFVQAAGLLPDVAFVLVGRWDGEAVQHLIAAAADNVTFLGHLSRPALNDELRRAAVYVQASRHEGFGMAVAEAMIAGCVPVVTTAGALPEVVGDAGIMVAEPTPEAVAAGVLDALGLGEQARERARQRILEHFPLERREGALHAVVAGLLAGEESRSHRVTSNSRPRAR